VALISEVDVATAITPKFTVSFEKKQGPLTEAILEILKPTFLIRSDFGVYTYAPYGEAEGTWVLPLFFLLLALIGVKKWRK